MSRQTRLPAIPTLTKDNIQQVVQAIKETLEVGERNRGQQIDGYVKFRDLVDLNLAKEDAAGGGAGGGGGGVPVLPIPAFPDGYNPEADYTAPPVPTNLRADGAFSLVILSWDAATFRNYAYTEIWRSEEDALGGAVRVGTSVGNVYSDPALEGKTYYYWVRFVSLANVNGPYNMTSGTVAKTAIKPERLLELLRGQITQESLYSDLANRIELIDAPPEFPGSINGRLRDVVQQVSATVNGMTAAIEQRFQITQNLTDGLVAQYSVKIDNNGYIAGFGLSNTRPTAGPTTSTFAVRADTFYIANPAGPGVAPAMPFIVRTTPVTINGVLVPVGVYMTDAFIQNGTITNLKVANAAIDDAKIANLSAAKLTVGDGTIGGVLKSGNYVANTSGWIVRPDGTAEFSAASIRGQLTAAQINSNGLLIRDGSGNIIFGSGYPITSANSAIGNGSNFLENGHFKEGVLGVTPVPGTLIGAVTAGLNLGGGTYQVRGEGTIYIEAIGTQPATAVGELQFRNGAKSLSVSPGRRYEAYAWINGQRCTGQIVILWLNATGTFIGEATGNVVGPNTSISGISSTADMFQSLVFAAAPSLATQAVLVVRMKGVNIGPNSYLFVSRVYFGEAGSAQTEASPWSPGSGMTQITPGNASTYIAAASIDSLQVKDAAIVEAKIGDAAIGNAKIKDYIQSNDYAAGSAGWKINKFGEAEFNNVTVRGKLRAAQIYTGSQYLDRTSNLQVPTTGFGFYKPGTLNGTGVFTDLSMKFVGPSAHSGVDYLHRCRGRETALVNEVPFFITATADVDDYFSLWVRYDGGSWAFLISTRNQTGGYGPATFTYGLSVDFGVYTTVEFGVRCTDSAGNPFNGAAVDIQNMALCVQCFNL